MCLNLNVLLRAATQVCALHLPHPICRNSFATHLSQLICRNSFAASFAATQAAMVLGFMFSASWYVCALHLHSALQPSRPESYSRAAGWPYYFQAFLYPFPHPACTEPSILYTLHAEAPLTLIHTEAPGKKNQDTNDIGSCAKPSLTV